MSPKKFAPPQYQTSSYSTANLPLFDELCKDAKEVGWISCFRVLREHEAELPVGVLHFGKGAVQVFHLLAGMLVEAVRETSQGFLN